MLFESLSILCVYNNSRISFYTLILAFRFLHRSHFVLPIINGGDEILRLAVTSQVIRLVSPYAPADAPELFLDGDLSSDRRINSCGYSLPGVWHTADTDVGCNRHTAFLRHADTQLRLAVPIFQRTHSHVPLEVLSEE